MPTIKEYREFFLRSAPVNAGAKRDQETGFPVQYTVDGELVFNRFLKDHYPSEDVFTKLFESLTFKLNPEDTATAILQGLAKAALDNDAEISTQSYTDGMTRFVRPYQIHTTIADPVPDNVVVTVTPYSKPLAGGRTRREYKIKANYTPPTPKIRVIYSGTKHQNTTILNGGNMIELLDTISIPAGALATDGDRVEIRGLIKTNGLFPTQIFTLLLLSDAALNNYVTGFFDTGMTDWRWEFKVNVIRVDVGNVLVEWEYRNESFANNVPTIISLYDEYAFNTAIQQDLTLSAKWGGGVNPLPIGAITVYPVTATLYTI